VGNLLMEALIASKDAKILNTFDAALSNMTQEQDRAKADLERLPSIKTTARTALVADDSKSMLAIQRAILTDLGFAPTPVSDGAQALAKAAKETFDLVVTDMNMPVMDGMELIQELRAMEQYKTIPIVMVTTESEATQRDLARQSGVSAFITKPFTAKALKSVITELTEQ
jgi:CheY-like chemotaxis protein